MNYRSTANGFGRVSEIGLGCWQLGGADWGDVSDDDAVAILKASVENGVTFFDTADVYGLGRSEELIGRYLKHSGANILVGTKLGRFPEPGWPGNFEPAVIRKHTEESLKRLGVDRIDLTQLHCIPTDVLRAGDVFVTLRELQEEGKIAAFGVSVESMDEAAVCLETPGVASLQIIFSILRQKPINAIFDLAAQKGISVIVRLPLASGLLSGKFSASTAFQASDHRNYNRDGAAFNVGETFAGLPFETGLEIVERIRPMVPPNITMAAMALRWCLDHDAVTTVIPGASGATMAVDNAIVTDLPPLSRQLHADLEAIYTSSIEAHIRGPN